MKLRQLFVPSFMTDAYYSEKGPYESLTCFSNYECDRANSWVAWKGWLFKL